MKRSRRIILACVGVAAILIFLRIVWPEDEGPSYHGLTLARALRTVDEVDDSKPEFKVAVNAIQQIGTNGLPFVLKRINHEPPAWKNIVGRHIPQALFFKFPEFFGPIISDAQTTRADAAINVFATLRETAVPTIPTLTNMLSKDRPDTSGRAVSALACIGTNGLGQVLRVATNVSYPHSIRLQALDSIGKFGTNAPFVIPPLIEILNDPLLASEAATALGELKLQPAVVVPALKKCLRSEHFTIEITAIEALGEYGPVATSAIPDLLAACTNKNPLVCAAATNALHAIAPDVYKASDQ